MNIIKASDTQSPPEELSVFDTKNPRSVVNLVPETFGKHIKKLGAQWFNLSYAQLQGRCHPTEVEERLRITFWNEYFQAQQEHRKMFMHRIFEPVCTREYFYKVVMKTESKLAWVLNPPAGYQIIVEEMLNLGLTRIREVLQLPLKDRKTGKVDHKLINEMVKITMFLDNRVKGAVTQRYQIQQSNLNVNVNQEMREAPRTMEEIEKELKQLDSEIKSFKNLEYPEQARLVGQINEGRKAQIIDVEEATASIAKAARDTEE